MTAQEYHKALRAGAPPRETPAMRYPMLTVVTAVSILSPALARAQAPSPDAGVHASAGVGAGGEGVAALASLGFRQGHRLITVRYARTEELNILGPSPEESRSDVSVMIGRIENGRHGFVSGSAGLGLVSQLKRGERLSGSEYGLFGGRYESVHATTVGMAVSGKAVLAGRYAGIGLEAFGNINPKASFAGLALTLHLGRLR
jgi:hypothetical protein